MRSSSTDNSLIADAVSLAERIRDELLGQVPLNSFEDEILYKAQIILSRWRFRTEEVQVDPTS